MFATTSHPLRRGLVFPACAIALLISGCAANPTGGVDFVLMSRDKEVEIGKEHHQEVLKAYRVYPDKKLQEYVDRIGQELAAKSHRPELEYHFTVLDSEEVNAFALPGGYIYVSRGLLAYLNSEAELAAVLGHEIGHVTARHAARQQSGAQVASVASIVAAVGTGTAAAADITNLFGSALVRGYGRKMELEADELGAEYLARTNYSPEAMIDVIRTLKDQETFELERARTEGRQPRIYHGIFATHPDKDTRLREAIESANAVSVGEDPHERRYTYLLHLDGMPFGKSTEDGTIQGNRYYNPELGITLTFPWGWGLQTQGSRVAAYSPARDAMVQMSTLLNRESLTPEQVLTEHMGRKADRGEALNNGGLAGYTAIVARDESPFGSGPVRYGIINHGQRTFLIAAASKEKRNPSRYDDKFMESINSLRLLDDEERRMPQQARIRLLKAGVDTSIDTLAEESAIPKYAAQELRLINSLYPDKEPLIGQVIKIVK